MSGKQNLKLAIIMNRFIRRITMLDRRENACQGVTFSQHYVIDALARKNILTMNELSRELGLAVSTLTRIVDVLVRDGLVSRGHSTEDRRKVCIELTAQGKKLAETLNTCAEWFWGTVLENLPEEKKQEITNNLKLLLKALEHAEDSHCPKQKSQKRK